jgi:hypothetical protein
MVERLVGQRFRYRSITVAALEIRMIPIWDHEGAVTI